MIADTNVLVRAWAGDDDVQAGQARAALERADHIYLSLATLCEFVWVLRQIYRLRPPEIAEAVKTLALKDRVVAERNAIEAGLFFLERGGDFADGVIEFEGRRLGGRIFTTFDRKAAAISRAQGRQCLLLGAE